MMNEVIEKMKSIADSIYKTIKKKKLPSIELPVRSLQNVEYDSKEGYFKILGKMKERALTASTIKTFAQTLLLMNESKKVVESDDIMTKREAYYVSKNWGNAKFKEQPESDSVMDDIEGMMMIQREKLGFIPEEDGGAVAGPLTIIDKDPEVVQRHRIERSDLPYLLL